MTDEKREQIEERIKKLDLKEIYSGQGASICERMDNLETDVAGVKSKFENAMNPEISYAMRKNFARAFYQTAPIVAPTLGPDKIELIQDAMIYLGCAYELE